MLRLLRAHPPAPPCSCQPHGMDQPGDSGFGTCPALGRGAPVPSLSPAGLCSQMWIPGRDVPSRCDTAATPGLPGILLRDEEQEKTDGKLVLPGALFSPALFPGRALGHSPRPGAAPGTRSAEGRCHIPIHQRYLRHLCRALTGKPPGNCPTNQGHRQGHAAGNLGTRGRCSAVSNNSIPAPSCRIPAAPPQPPAARAPLGNVYYAWVNLLINL